MLFKGDNGDKEYIWTFCCFSMCLLVALDLVSQPRQHEVGPTWYVIRLCVTDQTDPSLGVLGWLVRLRKVSLSTGHHEPPNLVDV